MHKCVALTLSALLLLTGACGGPAAAPSADPTSGSDTVKLTSVDGFFSVQAPTGWKNVPDQEQIKTPLVARGTDPIEQLVVTLETDTGAAYDAALVIVTGLTDGGADCKPVTIEDNESFVCAAEFEGQAFHRVLVAVEVGESSLGLLVQTPSATTEEALALVTPIVRSIAFE